MAADKKIEPRTEGRDIEREYMGDVSQMTRELEILREELERQREQNRVARTALASVEKKFLLHRRQLALATNAGGIGIWTYDPATGKTDWNDQLYRLLGLEPGSGLEDGETFFSFIHPEDRKGALVGTQAVLAEGNELDMEFRIVRADSGKVRWLMARGNIDRDAAGNPLRIQGVNFDITERKRHEFELRQSREHFRSVLEHTLDIPFCRNIQTKQFDYIGPMIQTITGFSRDEILEMNSPELIDLVHPEDQTRVAADLERAFKTGTGKLQFRFRKKDGGYLWMEDHFTVQKDSENRPLHRIGVMRDIEDQKRAEKKLEEQRQALSARLLELERINLELSEFAYAVSHDLKAPLRAVRNYADFLLEDLGDRLQGEQKTYLEGMKKASAQGDALIRDLLNYSRIGRTPAPPEAIDLEVLLREVVDLLNLSEAEQVSIESRCPAITADRALLKKVMVNLVSNGLKFNRSDIKRIEVTCRQALYGRIALFVKDNGIGIESRYHDQIFRVFHRLHLANTYEGTGIGLAIVRKAAAQMGGAIRVESKPGEGSTFIVELPATPPPPAGQPTAS